MTQEAAVPQDLIAKLQGMWRQDIANSSRAASIRNASISAGGTLSITGGAFILEDTSGHKLFYVGPLDPPNTDGTAQQGWSVERADGTVVLQLRDAFPSGGVLNQALSWYDRTGHTVVADDTDGGEGLARPWIPLPHPAQTATSSWPNTNATSWGVIAQSFAEQQHPKIYWNATAIADAGTTAQVRLNINNGETIGPVHSVATGGTTFIGDTITLPSGYFGSLQLVNVEAQVTGGTGSIRVQTWGLYGRQT